MISKLIEWENGSHANCGNSDSSNMHVTTSANVKFHIFKFYINFQLLPNLQTCIK